MTLHQASSKITLDHLERYAVVYIRQSSKYQVLHNTASTAQQYAMASLAHSCGWAADKIIINDKDQGLSGASTEKREGFKEMVAQTVSGNVGAIFALEASRLAREDIDWQMLVKLSGNTKTLLVDECGVYAAQELNDKLLLDMKGMFAVFERQQIKSRLVGGKLARAKEGKLRFRLPPGYSYSPSGDIIIDPDKNIQGYVQLFFEQFNVLGSALGVTRYFRDHNLMFPTRDYNAEYKMMPLLSIRAVKLIRNPFYAGTYVYGRRQTVPSAVLDGQRLILKTKIIEVSQENWTVVIPKAHEAYITEERYQENLRRLEANQFKKNSKGVGAARPGSALLQGLVRCGICGNKMSVGYQGKNNAPTYKCFGVDKLDHPGKCTIAAAVRVDPAVSEHLLRALVPAPMEASFGSLEQIEADMQRHIDIAKSNVDEAERLEREAERLYLQVASENGRVKSALELKWEEACAQVERSRQDYEILCSSPRKELPPEEKASLMKLLGELPELWESPATSHIDRKELLRLVVEDVILLRVHGFVKVVIRWQGGGRQEFEVPWPNFPESNMTAPATIDLIRQLAVTHTDTQIAEHLNREGVRPLRAKQFTRTSIFRLRDDYSLRGCNSANHAGFSGQREDGRYSVRAAAAMLGVSRSCISSWCHSGKLDTVRASTNSKFWIKLSPEDIPRLKQSVRRVRYRRAELASQP